MVWIVAINVFAFPKTTLDLSRAKSVISGTLLLTAVKFRLSLGPSNDAVSGVMVYLSLAAEAPYAEPDVRLAVHGFLLLIIYKGITAYINIKSVKLSKQQKYILTLLAQSYKNTEIIEMTGLSLNTIRSHTRILYQKLGVNNAADAVIEAKRLGIIES